MGKITIVRGDDWEGLYYNGELEIEGHRVDLEDALTFASDFPVFNVESVEADIDWLNDRGSLPMQLEEVKRYVI